jgi:hypothetical protein
MTELVTSGSVGGDGQQWLSLPGNYYHHWRTHLSLGMDSPESRPVQSPVLGKVVHNQRSVVFITIMNGWRYDSV